MNTTPLHPDNVLEALLSVARHPVKRRNLVIVHAVCEDEKKKASKDFTLATIATIVEASGGPKKKTMWNDSCADYRKLIEGWQAYAGTPALREISKIANEDGFLRNIEDPAVRIVVEKALAERNSLRAQVNILKAQSNLIIDRRPARIPASESAVIGSGMTLEVPSIPILNASEREALEHAISLEFWQAEGWKEEKNGRLVKEVSQGRTRGIFKPGFTTAIRKILSRK